MSNSPSDLLGLRSRLAGETGLSTNDIGIAADQSHLSSGGYHCGGLDLRRINGVGRDDYSIRQPRDRAFYNFEITHGSNLSSAMDVGDDWPRGGRAAWIRFNNLLRAQLGARDPALAAVRGINYTPNGSSKRRFDSLTGQETSTTDTVTWHTHIEWWRDTVGTAARAQSIDRIVQIAVAARNNQPVITQGDDDMFLRTPNGTIYLAAGGKTVSVSGAEWAGVSPQSFTSVPQSLVDKLTAQSGPTAADIAAAVIEALPEGDIDAAAILSALESDRGQAALVRADETAHAS